MAHNKTLAGAPPQDEEAVPPAGKSLLNDDQHGMAPDGSARNRKCPCADCFNGKKPRREYHGADNRIIEEFASYGIQLAIK